MKAFVRSDIDGFFGLALDNLVQLLLINTLCATVLGFPSQLIYGRILPGAAVSLLVGNLFYSWQALRLAKSTGRDDVCALPYGINTVSIFAFVFLVMLPVKLAAEAAGHPDPAKAVWQAGLVACLCSGVIEFAGAFCAERIRRLTPRAALLSTLGGIALGFISLGFLFRTFARPLVGFTTLGIILLTYFGRVRFRGGIPGGMVAVAAGTALAWLTGIAPTGQIAAKPGLYLPVPVIGDLVEAISSGYLLQYLSIAAPMGLFALVGSMQNIESAEAAGDPYPTRPSLAMNGVGTLAAACFGSCFPTTLYIGHPGWKSLGARAGYSSLNGLFFTLVCLTGTISHIAWAIPVDAGMAIVIWIGIVICAQAFQATPSEHAPAVVLGLLPGVAAWGAIMAKNGLRAAGMGTPGNPMNPALIESFKASDTWIHGAFALEQGFIFTSMILAATTVGIIEREFAKASIWCFVGAALSAVGIMHSYAWTAGDTVISISPGWPWALGYTVMGAFLITAKWLTKKND